MGCLCSKHYGEVFAKECLTRNYGVPSCPLCTPDCRINKEYLKEVLYRHGSSVLVLYEKLRQGAAEENAARIAAEGLPHNPEKFGPPAPPNNASRLETLQELGILDKPPNPNVDAILQATRALLDVEVVLITLQDRGRIVLPNTTGDIVPGVQHTWVGSMCAWLLSAPSPQVLVIEDMAADARLRACMFVAKPNGLRFYCGAPLIASNGHRLGSLCLVDSKVRSVDAGKVNMLANLAELVVREFEASWALARRNDAANKLLRSVNVYNEAVLVVDVTVPGWKIMHLNSAAASKLGLSVQKALHRCLWDLCTSSSDGATGSDEGAPYAGAIRKYRQFVVPRVRFSPNVGSDRAWQLTFRPGDTEALDDDMQLIGVPAHVRAEANITRRVYFVSVKPASRGMLLPLPSTPSTPSHQETPFPGLTLGQLLGAGSYGRVYRGRLEGAEVAVKITTDSSLVRLKNGESLEALITSTIKHENIVRTLQYAWALPPPPGSRLFSGRWSGASWNRNVDSRADSLGRASSGASGSPPGSGPGWRRSPKRASKPSPRPSKGGKASMKALRGLRGSKASRQGSPAPSKGGSTAGSASVGSTSRRMQLWLVMEFCAYGALKDAIDKGWFRERPAVAAPPNMRTILATASELASAMACLHANNILHGDLSGGNILLAKAADAPHGFAAKVADFGLARELAAQARIQTESYATITHIAPEHLVQGILSMPADVYAFGVLLWELYNGSRAWAGMQCPQIVIAVTLKKARLHFPDTTPPAFRSIAERCMAHDPEDRPTFSEVHSILLDLHAALADSPAPPSPPPPDAVASAAAPGSGELGSGGYSASVSSGEGRLRLPGGMRARGAVAPSSDASSGLSEEAAQAHAAARAGPVAAADASTGAGAPPPRTPPFRIVDSGEGDDPLFSQAQPFAWDSVAWEGDEEGGGGGEGSQGLGSVRLLESYDLGQLHELSNSSSPSLPPSQQSIPSRAANAGRPPDQGPGHGLAAGAVELGGPPASLQPTSHPAPTSGAVTAAGAPAPVITSAVQGELLHSHAGQQRHGNLAAGPPESAGFPLPQIGIEEARSTVRDPGDVPLLESGPWSASEPEEGPGADPGAGREDEDGIRVFEEGPLDALSGGSGGPRKKGRLRSMPSVSEDEVSDVGERWGGAGPSPPPGPPRRRRAVRLLQEVPLEVLGSGGADPGSGAAHALRRDEPGPGARIRLLPELSLESLGADHPPRGP